MHFLLLYITIHKAENYEFGQIFKSRFFLKVKFIITNKDHTRKRVHFKKQYP